jgi:hypothetical protein
MTITLEQHVRRAFPGRAIEREGSLGLDRPLAEANAIGHFVRLPATEEWVDEDRVAVARLATTDDELYDPHPGLEAPKQEPVIGWVTTRLVLGAIIGGLIAATLGAAIAALLGSAASIIVAAALAGLIIGGTAAALIALMPEFGSEEGELAVHHPEDPTTGLVAVPTTSLAQAEKVGMALVRAGADHVTVVDGDGALIEEIEPAH